ncbi:MAG: hypothetical protein M1824_000371 [Vezdaea acicularis]|nr:MAG: hypothetical protein M1824_000371 [Vezdaea acicularis]
MRGADITRPLPTDVEGREEDADTETSGDENLRKGSEGKVIGFTPGDVRPLEVDEGEYGEEEAEEDKGSLGGDGMDVYVDGMNVDMDEEAGTPSNEELAKLAQTVLQRHEMNPTYSFSDDEMDERWRSRSLSREL